MERQERSPIHPQWHVSLLKRRIRLSIFLTCGVPLRVAAALCDCNERTARDTAAQLGLPTNPPLDKCAMRAIRGVPPSQMLDMAAFLRTSPAVVAPLIRGVDPPDVLSRIAMAMSVTACWARLWEGGPRLSVTRDWGTAFGEAYRDSHRRAMAAILRGNPYHTRPTGSRST